MSGLEYEPREQLILAGERPPIGIMWVTMILQMSTDQSNPEQFSRHQTDVLRDISQSFDFKTYFVFIANSGSRSYLLLVHI